MLLRTMLLATLALLTTAGAAAAGPTAVNVSQAGDAVSVGLDPAMPAPTDWASRALRELDAAGLNPQPDPPMPPWEATLQGALDTGLAAVAFNPQPEPPGRPSQLTSAAGHLSTGLEEVGFNPQPEPPALPGP